MKIVNLATISALLMVMTVHPVAAGNSIQTLIATYPAHLKSRDGNMLVWHDGTRMVIFDGRKKTHQTRLKTADIEDMMSQPYPVGPCSFEKPKWNYDPGRIRNEAFFRKMYGNSAARVKRALTTIDWFGRRLRVTKINGVDKQLAKVAAGLARLPKKMRKYLVPMGGTFKWRKIAGTNRLSVHSFGAAIDINTKYSDYWRWSGGKPGKVPKYKNRVPRQIVEVFERHGFIWGGKWYHYDTMHFEYRPELLAMSYHPKCGQGSAN